MKKMMINEISTFLSNVDNVCRNQVAHTLTAGTRTTTPAPSHAASCVEGVGPPAPGQPWSSSREEACALAAKHANRELHLSHA